MPIEFDDNGWLIGEATALAVADSYSLLSPDATTMLNGARISHQAKKFFAIDLTLVSNKQYPAGGYPRFDRAELALTRGDVERRIALLTMPLDKAPDVLRTATETANRVGAGLDALVARAVRLWQIPSEADDPFPLALAAVLASLLLAPILPPGGDAVFGVKTARARLADLGWRT